MKINIDQIVPHKSGLPIESNVFVVHVHPSKNIGYTFIVAALDSADAIVRVKNNAQEVIDTIRGEMTLEDMCEHDIMADLTPAEMSLIRELEANLLSAKNKFENLEDSSGFIADDMLALLTDKIAHIRLQINELRKPKPTGKKTSRFLTSVQRMTDILREGATFQAERLDGNRAIPVSYFDDSRSITNYCG